MHVELGWGLILLATTGAGAGPLTEFDYHQIQSIVFESSGHRVSSVHPTRVNDTDVQILGIESRATAYLGEGSEGHGYSVQLATDCEKRQAEWKCGAFYNLLVIPDECPVARIAVDTSVSIDVALEAYEAIKAELGDDFIAVWRIRLSDDGEMVWVDHQFRNGGGVRGLELRDLESRVAEPRSD